MYIPRNRLFWAVSLGHFTNDLMLSMAPVILAFLSITILPMTNTQIGFVISSSQLLGALTQPAFGVLADRNGGRMLSTLGLSWLVGLFLLSLAIAQLTGNYWLMFVPFVLQTLGSGIIHPVGAMHAAETTTGRSASNTAYFFLMGQLGLALGPAIAGILLDLANNGNITRYFVAPFQESLYLPQSANLVPIYVFGLAAIPTILFLFTTLPSNRTHQAIKQAKFEQLAKDIAKPVIVFPWKGFSILALVVIFRSLAQPGAVPFIPILFQQKGWSPSEYGLITSSFWIASGFSGVIFGQMADRYDRRYVIMASMVLSAPPFFLLPLTDGAIAFTLAIIAGGLSGGAHSIIVVLAQDLIPISKGFASGAIVGFIFATGALGSLIIGTVSDTFGLEATFQFVSIFLVIAGLLGLLLPARAAVPELVNESPLVTVTK